MSEKNKKLLESNRHFLSFRSNLFSREKTLIILRLSKLFFDFLLLNLAFLFAYFIKVGFIFSSDLSVEKYLSSSFFGVILWIICSAFLGIYKLSIAKQSKSLFIFIISGIVGVAAMNNFFFFAHKSFFSREISILAFFLGIFVLTFSDFIFRIIEKKLISLRKLPLRSLFLGAGRETEKIIKKIKKDNFREVLPVAILDAKGGKKKDILRVPVLGKFDKLEKVTKEKKIEAVFLCDHLEHTFNIVSFAEGNFLELFILPSILGIFSERISMRKVSKLPLISLQRTRLFGWKKFFKDTFDFIFAFIFLLIFLPLFILISIANLILNKKVLSRELRIGKEGREFNMYRFYTGKIPASKYSFEETFQWRQSPTPHKFAYFLRKTFFSELPQLFNVIKGEMSFLGPRPPYKEEFAEYKPYFKRRVSVKPGICGIWQIRVAKNEEGLDFKKMIDDDIEYISRWSFGLDFRILYESVKVFFGAVFFRF